MRNATVFEPVRIGSLRGDLSFWLAVFLVVTVLAVVHVTLRLLIETQGVRVGAVSGTCAPLYAYVRPHFKGWLLIPLAWFALLAFLLRRTNLFWGGTALRFSVLLYTTAAITYCSVAVLDGGPDRLVAPFLRFDLEYSGAVSNVGDPLQFLVRYQDIARSLPMHCQNHPPGAVLFLWFVSYPFGGAVSAMAGAVILVAALLPALAYTALRAAVPEMTARRGALLLLACPAVVLFSATSMDAVFGVLMAVGVACVIRGQRSTTDYRWIWFLAGGAALGVALLMTYTVAVALLWCVLYMLVTGERSFSSWGLLFGGAVLPTALASLLGYRPFEVFVTCVAAHHEIMSGSAHDHPVRWAALAVGNLTAYSIGCGILMTAAALYLCGWPSNRGHGGRILSVSLVTLLIAAIAPVYTLEVERIWMFLCVPVAVGVVCAANETLPDSKWVGLWRLLLWAGVLQTLLTEIWLETYW